MKNDCDRGYRDDRSSFVVVKNPTELSFSIRRLV